MRPIVLKYGFISGIIFIAMIFTMMALVGNSTDFEKGEKYGYLFMIPAYSMIFLGIRNYRDKKSGGAINFNQGFRVGILITWIASLCYAAGWLIYFNFIDHSFVERYTVYYSDKLSHSAKTAEEIAKEIAAFKESMHNYKNPFIMAMYTLLEVFPVGLIISILCAMLMRRKPAVKPVT